MVKEDGNKTCENRIKRDKKNSLRRLRFFITGFIGLTLIIGLVSGVRAGEMKPGTASGSIVIDGTSMKLNYAYAMAQPNTFDKEKTDIAILLTENPVQNETFKDVEDLRDVAVRQRGWLYFEINDEQKPITEVADHPSLGATQLQMSGITRSDFVKKEFSKERIAGSCKTKNADEILGHKYEVDVTFNAPILQAKIPEPLPDEKTGKALPPDGGAPGKAYLNFVKAVQKKDLETVKKFAPSPEEGIDYNDEELKEMIEFMAELTPKDLKITKGFIKGDRAVLYVTGTLEEEKQYGTIEMIKKEGSWRVKEESWSDTPPEK
jgi:hypothetical protein